MNLASLAKGRMRRSHQKAITYTYTVNTSRKPEHISSRSRVTYSPGGASSSRDSGSGSDSARLPNEIRPGYVIVYVGSERKRFIIASGILNHALFKLVLEKLDSGDVVQDQAQGFQDYDDTGAILLSCDVQLLHRLLFLIDSAGNSSNQEMRWEELKKYLDGDATELPS